ncbi:hypothetical protein ACIRUY_20415 [Streptomyces erythrochromogenes]|uniref:hypothetical protein n=1 Tax=Streptomyces erythrochromogenes TaxID=285574 RepID=UPI00382C3E46
MSPSTESADTHLAAGPLLRAHLFTPHSSENLLALRQRTGVRLALFFCHRRTVQTFLERELRQVEHHTAEAEPPELPAGSPSVAGRQAAVP